MKWINWVFIGAVVSALVVSVAAITRGDDDVDPPLQEAPTLTSVALTVSTVRPREMLWSQSIATSGSIAAWQEAMVSAEVGGIRMAEVLVDVGDRVKAGQLLARFDDATVRAILAQQQALLAEAEANLAEAEATASRAKQMRASSNISEQDLISARTRERAAQAQVQSAQARLENQALVLQYTQVNAPDDGVVSSRSAMLGSVPGIGNELFRLVRQNRLEWRAELTASQIPQIKPGMLATITLPDGAEVSGRVRQLAPTLDSTTRTGIAFVELEVNGSARPGMYAAGTIILGELQALTVPSSAVIVRDGRDYVFAINEHQHARLVQVTTGRRQGRQVEILSGIDDGQDLVVSGGTFLNDGDLVRVAGTIASS